GGVPPADTVVVDTTLVISSDPELRRVVAGLLPGLAEQSGLELREPVRVERRTRDQLTTYLEAKLDEDMGPERADHTIRSYALLGLAPPDLDLRDLLLNVYTEQVAGFYDPDSTALFVLDDQPREMLTTVLVHELVHAVQDQTVDLDSLTDRSRGSDHQIAAQAAIEGHATLVMLEFVAGLQGRPVDLSRIPDFAEKLRPALEAVRTQYPALGNAPRIVQESMLFPYLEGAGFVQALWRSRDGRPPPFGADLPQSTEQVMDPDRLLGATPDPPTEVRVAVEGRPAVYRTTLGALETGILLEELVGSEAAAASRGWDGDELALVETSAGDALAWATVWDDPASRDGFVRTLEPALGKLPAAALERREVDGRPVAVLRVGALEGVSVSLQGG
ncbi:MAG TPA: DUF6782 family putative metallopeptidase, partial [Longimicrobiales bacterium]|nr:DUF6782 family putative metallopeptidase [Longimicrobiales bacterium]